MRDLPEGWKQLTDPNSGKFYYANMTTNTTQWERPASVIKKIEPLKVEKKITVKPTWVKFGKIYHDTANDQYSTFKPFGFVEKTEVENEKKPSEKKMKKKPVTAEKVEKKAEEVKKPSIKETPETAKKVEKKTEEKIAKKAKIKISDKSSSCKIHTPLAKGPSHIAKGQSHMARGPSHAAIGPMYSKYIVQL